MKDTKEAIIRKFFASMVCECTGSDNGVDPVLDDYLVENLLEPYMNYYIEQLNKEEQL
jgi:hypothetical protein